MFLIMSMLTYISHAWKVKLNAQVLSCKFNANSYIHLLTLHHTLLNLHPWTNILYHFFTEVALDLFILLTLLPVDNTFLNCKL